MSYSVACGYQILSSVVIYPMNIWGRRFLALIDQEYIDLYWHQYYKIMCRFSLIINWYFEPCPL